jgi:branched-chain amino acid transport system ATP-binding protein
VLELTGLCTRYGAVQALWDVSLAVSEGEIVAIVGANGAGKSTLLRTIAGMLRPTRGRIVLEERDITGLRSHQLAKLGIVLVPEGRQLFGNLSADENLRLGAFPRYRTAGRAEITADLEFCRAIFPVLATRRNQLASTLSGGEQQMLAIARGLMAQPRLLLLDEPSLGLAPQLIAQIFQALVDLRRDRRLTIMLVEQDTKAALELADRGYVMQNGRIVLHGRAKDLMNDTRVREIYFGSVGGL